MRVFLSHSRRDQKLARKISQFLVKQGIELWFDEWKLEPGENFAHAIGEGLESSDVMVILVSQDSMTSWQREEIQYAITTPRFEGRVIPVLVKQTPNVPWILETLNVVRPGKTDDETAQRVADALQQLVVG